MPEHGRCSDRFAPVTGARRSVKRVARPERRRSLPTRAELPRIRDPHSSPDPQQQVIRTPTSAVTVIMTAMSTDPEGGVVGTVGALRSLPAFFVRSAAIVGLGKMSRKGPQFARIRAWGTDAPLPRRFAPTAAAAGRRPAYPLAGRRPCLWDAGASSPKKFDAGAKGRHNAPSVVAIGQKNPHSANGARSPYGRLCVEFVRRQVPSV